MLIKRYRSSIVLALAAGLLVGLPAGIGIRAELITHLSMDGNLDDEGPGGNDGTFFGDLDPIFVDGFDGTIEGAILLDGVDDYVELLQSSGLPLTHNPVFSIAMWVKGGIQTDKRVFSESSDVSGTPLFNIGTHNQAADGTVDGYIRATGVTPMEHRHSAGTAFDDTWHHIAWVDDNGSVTLYIDGVPDSTDFSYTRPGPEMAVTTIGGIYRPSNATPTCCFFMGAIDDVRLYDHALTEQEVIDLVPDGGCPEEGDTTCDDLAVDGPGDNAPGDYTLTSLDAEDDSGDPILYTFQADDGAGTVLVAGPQAEDFTLFTLLEGTWTLSVTVDDDLNCDDASEFNTCERTVTVACPEQGDTNCNSIDVEPPPAGNIPGTYSVSADASDIGGDPVMYTFTADNGVDAPIVKGPVTDVNTTLFTLGPGEWTISVTVDDDALCDDSTGNEVCSTTVTVTSTAEAMFTHLPLDGDVDDAVGDNDGTFTGDIDAVYTPGFDDTDPGAILLDGIDDFVSLFQDGNLPIYAQKAYSIGMWVKGPPNQADLRIYSEANSFSSGVDPHPFGINPLFNIGTHNGGADGTVDLYIRGDSGQTPVAHRHSARTAFDDTWHHITWVDDDGNARLYIDAIRDQTNFQYTRIPLTLDTTTVGAILRAGPSHWFQGEIDDVRLYNHALSLEEVQALVPEADDCPGDNDTKCDDLIVEGPPGNLKGIYTLTAAGSDTSGDSLVYTFVAENTDGDYLQVGPDAANSVQMTLGAGDWTISVTVDDNIYCRDDPPQAVCSQQVTVVTPEPILVSHWELDGDLDDSGDAGNDGFTVGGGIPAFGDDRDGNPESAICLDSATDDFIQAGIVDTLPVYENPTLDAYSIALWVKGLPQNDRRVYSESSMLNTSSLFNIGTQNHGTTGQVDLFIRRSTGAMVMNHWYSDGIAFDGTWHHIAWVDADGDAVLYIDGVRDTASFAYNKQLLGDLDTATIGGILRSTGTCCKFDGCLDDVRVYNYALSEDEVLEIVNGGGGPGEPEFRRGDANGDGGLNITDGIYILNFLFLGGETPSCSEAADSNDDGQINITDGIYVLNFLFLGGAEPPAPGSNTCGKDPAGSVDLGCESYTNC